MYGQVYCGEKMIFLKHQTDLTSYPYNTVNQMVPHVTFSEPKVPYIYLQVKGNHVIDNLPFCDATLSLSLSLSFTIKSNSIN